MAINDIHQRTIPQGTIAWQWNRELTRHPLVVLHGLGDSAIETMAPLFQGAELPPTLFIDLPGFGHATAASDFDASMESYAHIVAALLNHLGVEPRAVFGHSMGGSIAIQLAAIEPQLVPNLIVAEALLVPENSVLATSIARRSEHTFAATGFSMLKRATRRQASRGDRAARAFAPVLDMANPNIVHRAACSLTQARDPSFKDLLMGLTMPRTFLIGSKTRAATYLISQSGVNLVTINNSGHSMVTENPQDSLREVQRAMEPHRKFM